MPSQAQGPVVASCFAWQSADARFFATIVAKATFLLGPSGEWAHADPQLPIAVDALYDGSQSLYVPSDLVPWKRMAEVVLVGHAHSPMGAPTAQLLTKLRVGDLQKSVLVHGDRRGGSAPAAFTRMPLRWERAARTGANPVGLAPGDDPPPNLEIQGHGEPCFGPLAPAWRERALAADGAAWSAAARGRGFATAGAMPRGFDTSFFQCAPLDQQLPALEPGTPLELEHLFAGAPRVSTRLPAFRPRARAALLGATPAEVPLRCDTLWIDLDLGVALLTFRAAIGIARAEDAASMNVHVTAEPVARVATLSAQAVAALAPSLANRPTGQAAAAAAGLAPLGPEAPAPAPAPSDAPSAAMLARMSSTTAASDATPAAAAPNAGSPPDAAAGARPALPFGPQGAGLPFGAQAGQAHAPRPVRDDPTPVPSAPADAEGAAPGGALPFRPAAAHAGGPHAAPGMHGGLPFAPSGAYAASPQPAPGPSLPFGNPHPAGPHDPYASAGGGYPPPPAPGYPAAPSYPAAPPPIAPHASAFTATPSGPSAAGPDEGAARSPWAVGAPRAASSGAYASSGAHDVAPPPRFEPPRAAPAPALAPEPAHVEAPGRVEPGAPPPMGGMGGLGGMGMRGLGAPSAPVPAPPAAPVAPVAPVMPPMPAAPAAPAAPNAPNASGHVFGLASGPPPLRLESPGRFVVLAAVKPPERLGPLAQPALAQPSLGAPVAPVAAPSIYDATEDSVISDDESVAGDFAPLSVSTSGTPAAPLTADSPVVVAAAELMELDALAVTSAKLAERGARRADVLAAAGISDERFTAAEKTWKPIFVKSRPLADRFDEVYVETHRRLRELDMAAYGRILALLERGALPQVQAELEVQMQDVLRVQRVFTKRLSQDPKRGIELNEALEQARRSL